MINAGQKEVHGKSQSRNSAKNNSRDWHKARSWLKVLIPVCSLILLAVFGGGLYPFHAFLVSLAILLIGLFTSFPAIKKSARIHWYLGVAVIVWLLFSIVPLPMSFLGEARTTAHNRAQSKVSEMAAIYNHPEINQLTGDPESLDKDDKRDDASSSEGEYLEAGINRSRLSLNYAGTVRFVLLFTGAWIIMWLTTAMNAMQRYWFAVVLVGGGTMVAALALLGKYIIDTGSNIWWFIPVEHRRIGGGPFINRDHFASFCAMLAPLAFSFVVDPFLGLSKKRDSHRRTGDKKKGKPRTTAKHSASDNLYSSRGKTGKRRRTKRGSGKKIRLVFAVCLAVLVMATVLSFSRGGMLMMLVAVGIVAAFWLKGRPALATGSTLLAISIICAFLFWPSSEVQQRIGTLHDFNAAMDYRTEMQREAVSQWKSFPVVGSGAESFRALNPIVRKVPGEKTPLYAHNEYLQILAETGIVGLILFAGLAGTFLFTVIRNIFRYKEMNSPSKVLRGTFPHEDEMISNKILQHPGIPPLAMIAASLGTIGGMMLHMAADFPCRIPLNAFLFASIAGLAMPLPFRSFRKRRKAWWWKNLVIAAVVAVLLVGWDAESLQLDEPQYLNEAELPELAKAVLYAPMYWVPWQKLSERSREEAQMAVHGNEEGNAEKGGSSKTIEFTPYELYSFGIDCLAVATEYNPRDYRMWRSLMLARRQTGNYEEKDIREPMHRMVELAPYRKELWQTLFDYEKEQENFARLWGVAEKAAQRSPEKIAAHLYWQIAEFEQGRDNIAAALKAVKEASRLQPRKFAYWLRRAEFEQKLDMLKQAEKSLEEATEIRPKRWKTWLELGKLRLKMNKDRGANKALSQAVNIKPDLRNKVDSIWKKFK